MNLRKNLSQQNVGGARLEAVKGAVKNETVVSIETHCVTWVGTT